MKDASVLRAKARLRTRNPMSRMGCVEWRSAHKNSPKKSRPQTNSTPAHAPSSNQIAPMDSELIASV